SVVRTFSVPGTGAQPLRLSIACDRSGDIAHRARPIPQHTAPWTTYPYLPVLTMDGWPDEFDIEEPRRCGEDRPPRVRCLVPPRPCPRDRVTDVYGALPYQLSALGRVLRHPLPYRVVVPALREYVMVHREGEHDVECSEPGPLPAEVRVLEVAVGPALRAVALHEVHEPGALHLPAAVDPDHMRRTALRCDPAPLSVVAPDV